MIESRKGPSFVHCKVCLCDFSVCSGGFNDVKRHIESKKHKDFENSIILHHALRMNI